MTFGFPFRLLSFVLAGSFLAVSASLAQPAPPVAPIRNVVDVYFGTKVTDPYRWMEDTKNPEFQAWMKSQNDYSRAVLESIPGREPLSDSIAQYDNGRVRILGLQKYGGRYFWAISRQVRSGCSSIPTASGRQTKPHTGTASSSQTIGRDH